MVFASIIFCFVFQRTNGIVTFRAVPQYCEGCFGARQPRATYRSRVAQRQKSRKDFLQGLECILQHVGASLQDYLHTLKDFWRRDV
jgi:hypothetical protein